MYLPAEISDEELKSEVDRVIKENQTVFDANKKAIIGICMKQLKSKADPERIMKVYFLMKLIKNVIFLCLLLFLFSSLLKNLFSYKSKLQFYQQFKKKL